MIKAIQKVYQGDKYFSHDITEILAYDSTNESHILSTTILTTREQLILRLISHEYSNKQIAQQLEISVRTVETHRRNIKQKLGIDTTCGLVRYAIEHRLDL